MNPILSTEVEDNQEVSLDLREVEEVNLLREAVVVEEGVEEEEIHMMKKGFTLRKTP